jgi:hypothetical protein
MPGGVADQIYSGVPENEGEDVVLCDGDSAVIDQVPCKVTL